MVILLTFLFFFIFIGIDLILQSKQQRQSRKRMDKEPFRPLKEYLKNFKLHTPSGVFLSKGHVWTRKLTNGNIQVGLDDFCNGLLTKIDSIKLRHPGDRINSDRGMCTLCQGEKKLSFYSPFDGIILEVNPLLKKDPKILCIDPYDKGWIYTFKPAFDTSYLFEPDKMVDETLKWQARERERLADFIREEPEFQKIIEQERKGGKASLQGFLDNLNGLSWLKFEKDFLK